MAKLASLKRKDFNLNLFNVHTTNASKWHVEEYYCNWTQSHTHTIWRIAVEVRNFGHRQQNSENSHITHCHCAEHGILLLFYVFVFTAWHLKLDSEELIQMIRKAVCSKVKSKEILAQ